MVVPVAPAAPLPAPAKNPQEYLVQLALAIQPLRDASLAAKLHRERCLVQKWTRRLQLGYLEASGWLRRVSDSALAWRWAVVLIAAAAAGAICFVATSSWLVGLCGVAMVAATTYGILHFPGDAKLAGIVESLRNEVLRLTSEGRAAGEQAARTAKQLAELQRQHETISSELTAAERRRMPVEPPPAPAVAAATPSPAPQVVPSQVAPQIIVQTVIRESGKSPLVAFLLAFFFGPLGMLYSTVPGAVVLALVDIVLFIPTIGFIFVLTGPIGCVWAAMAASSK